MHGYMLKMLFTPIYLLDFHNSSFTVQFYTIPLYLPYKSNYRHMETLFVVVMHYMDICTLPGCHTLYA